MRLSRFGVLLILFLVYGRTPVMPQAADSAESEVRLVMAKMRTASLDGDAGTIASLMTDEYLQTDISGHVQDKATWFKEYFNPLAELIKAGKFQWETMAARTSNL